jgi:hypothetical protein
LGERGLRLREPMILLEENRPEGCSVSALPLALFSR